MESGAQQGSFQGSYAVSFPSGRGFGCGDRFPSADDPFYGGGKKVIGRVVLASKSISNGPPSALLSKNGRTTHALSNTPELYQNRVRGFKHVNRHGRQEIIDHLNKRHFEIGQFAVGKFSAEESAGAGGHGAHRFNRDYGRKVPRLQHLSWP